MTRCPGPLEIEAAQVTGDIDGFADEVQSAKGRCLHGPGRQAVGIHTAEGHFGGVDTGGLSSRTMEATTVRGLYFVGEAVDVTGHLGGFNFQWAWASGHAAGQEA